MERIFNLVPVCGYNPDGIKSVWLLDFEDFEGYVYPDQDNYDKAQVQTVNTGGTLVKIAAPNMVAKYSSTGAYVHTLETFIPALTHDLAEQLNLAIRHRYVVFFRTNKGQMYTFGDEAGAVVSYVNQTAEGLGSLVTITAESIHPLYEMDAQALELVAPLARFVPNGDYSFCVTTQIGDTTYRTGIRQFNVMLKQDSQGNALDLAGKRISTTGNKQAIALRSGVPNPEPANYDVEFMYSTGAYARGAPTFEYNPSECPVP